MSVAGKLSDRFGSTTIFTIGTIILAFFNIMFLFKRLAASYVAVLILRGLAAVGMGLMVPSSMPVNFELVKQNKLPSVIAIGSMMLPIGAFIAALCAGIVGNSIGWNWMCVFVGIFGLIDCIL